MTNLNIFNHQRDKSETEVPINALASESWWTLGATMNISLRHIFLAIGLASLPLSYILIAYDLSVALLVVSYLTIFVAIVSVIKKDSVKAAATGFLVSAGVFVSTIIFRDTLEAFSYRTLISANENLLAAANQILMGKKGEVTYSSTFLKSEDEFLNEELNVLRKVTQNLNTRFIRKYPHAVYYCTDGVMASDYGIWYFYTNYQPNNFLHIKGRWYYE